MSVSYLWVGATGASTAVVSARLSEPVPSVRLAVSRRSDLRSASFFGPFSVTDDRIATMALTGLVPDARYHYAVEVAGELDTDLIGRFRTQPVPGRPTDIAIAAGSCAGLEPEYPGQGEVAFADGLSNHPVFDTVREVDPMMFLHMGDLHYYNLGSGEELPEHDVATYRAGYNDVFAQPRQHELYRSVATQYVWDDHDFGPNNSDSTSPGRAAACQVYRERVPHYRLHDEYGIWQEWRTGRVQFVLLDSRSYRSPNGDEDTADKTMLGVKQKQWLARLLASSPAKYLVLGSPSRWFDDSSDDTWDAFSHERAELIELFDSTGWLRRMCVLSGDVHAAAMDSGGNAPGGVPVFQFAALDSRPHSKVQDHYDLGPSVPGRNQYGTMRFTDTGDAITVRAVAWHGTDPLYEHEIRVEVE